VKNHAASGYPLEGKHVTVDCAQCHIPKGKDTLFKIKFQHCTDCHKDEHDGQFAAAPYLNNCERCHTLQGYKPSTFSLSRHKETRFVLTDGHMAVPCGTGVYDLLIVGAGPAGISASLRAIEHKLDYVTLERDEIGGTVAKYPRQKLVMTSPVEFPMYGKFKKTELSKETLLAFWDTVLNRADFNVIAGEKVDDIKKNGDGVFTVVTPTNHYRARAVVLALGRTGTPRKLGVQGEELPKVMYRLIEADHYINKQILVVGGGDSAVEAAMGLAHQIGNKVTLSYRQERFSRIKERNSTRIAECINKGKVTVLFNSSPVEFREGSAVIDVNGKQQTIPNDFVRIFAGGTPPNDFLKKIGVGFGMRDMASEASNEAVEAKLAVKRRSGAVGTSA
jgi:thioredoxin reductase (NADPH)